MTTVRLEMAELVDATAGNETIANAALRAIDLVINAVVLDRDLNTPPGSPTDGAVYIDAGTPTGAWTGHANKLHYWLNGWYHVTPKAGFRIWVDDEAMSFVYDGAAWLQTDLSVPTGTGLRKVALGVEAGAASLLLNADVDAAAAIAHSKLANVSATDRLLGRQTAGAGAIEEITCTAAARSVLDDTTVAAMRATLGAPERTISWQCAFWPRNLIGAGTLAVGDASVSDNTDMDGFCPGEDAADAARTDFAWGFFVPDELDVTAAVTATVYYRLQAAGTGAAVEVELTGRAVADNELAVSDGAAFNVGGGACVKDVSSYASGDIVAHSLGTVFGANTLALGDFVKGTIFRDAQVGNADDTFGNATRMILVKFTGTRKTA